MKEKQRQQLLFGGRHRWRSMVSESPGCEFPPTAQILKEKPYRQRWFHRKTVFQNQFVID